MGDHRAFQSGRLFTSPAEYKRISTLEPDYHLAFARFANEKLFDLSLICAVLAGLLADVNQFGALHCMFQQFSPHQSIVENNLRLLQTFFALQGEKIGISRPRADQIDVTQSGRHRLAPSMISYWKVQDLSYPDRTGLQLR